MTIGKQLKHTLKVCAFVLLAGVGESASAMICSTDPNAAIPQGSGSETPGAPASIDIDVPAFYTNAITDLDFLLQIDHTWVGDLVVTLESPAGTVVTLFDRPGRPPATFGCGGDNVDVTLDDEAATAVEDQCDAAVPTISGIHSPNDALSAFDGEAPAGTWTLTATDLAGGDLGTIISAGNCLNLTTVPVVLSSFETRKRGQRLIAEWQTSSEAFNLGFDLWGQVDGDWLQLNRSLISSKHFDSVEPQDYRRRVALNSLPGELTAVGISSFSSSGLEEFFGPFSVGESYGEQTIPRRIDWQQQRLNFDQAMQQAGYIKVRGRWVKATEKRQRRLSRLGKRFPKVWLDIDQEGIYQISYESLLASGFDLKGMPNHALALTRNGQAISRIVNGSSSNPKRFGPGGTIRFLARGPNDSDARYVGSSRYLLSFNPEKALAAPLVSAPRNVDSIRRINHHWQAEKVGDKNLYSFILPGEQPWYDSTVPAYRKTGLKVVTLNVPEHAVLERASKLKLNLLGAIDFPRVDADGDGDLEPHHHFKVYLNRALFPEPIHEGYANGFSPIELELDTLAQLSHGENKVEFELIPDNGFNLDAAYFIDAAIEYQVATKTPLSMGGILLRDTDGLLEIDVSQSIPHAIYKSDLEGNFAQLEPLMLNDGTWAVSLPSSQLASSANRFWLLNESDYLTPNDLLAVENVDDESLSLKDVDYVVISAPSLMGEELDSFVQRQIELGRRTKVVSSHSIFAQYSGGLSVPRAIRDYLSEQTKSSSFQYVLLVGNHTYNYRGFNVSEQQAPINLMPSFYREGDGLVRQLPTAVPFVDFDDDGAPDRAIGRWPVRDKVQLSKVINKTLTWHEEGSHRDSQSLLLIAGAKEALNEFTGSSERVYNAIGNELNPWLEPERVYMDTLAVDEAIEPGTEVSIARERIIAALNQGAALTVFNGHASPTSWSNQSLMTADVAEQLTNITRPSLMMPLACYTTYYETPNVKSLAELLFSDNEAGAVALTSAALLSRTIDNENFAKQLMQQMTVKGFDLGTAVMNVKRAIHKHGGRSQSMVYNWTTLGDPTLSFGLPDVTLPPVLSAPKGQ